MSLGSKCNVSEIVSGNVHQVTCADAVYSPNVFNSVYNHVKDVDIPTDQKNVATLSQVGKCDTGVKGVKKIITQSVFIVQI